MKVSDVGGDVDDGEDPVAVWRGEPLGCGVLDEFAVDILKGYR